MKQKDPGIIANLLFWPALLFPNARGGELIFLMGAGLVFWVVTCLVGIGFLLGRLI